MRDLANLNLRVGLGVLSGRVGTREASTATGSFREVRRTVVEGQRIGYEKEVLDPDQHEDAGGEDPLLAEERDLAARLAEVRRARRERERRDG